MFGLGFPELVVIFLVILLLFGAKALPDIAKGLGQAIRLFKKEVKDINADDTAAPPAKKSSDDFNPDASRRDWRPKGDAPSDKS